ncbi:type III secretion system export apparatus subunit SctT [Exilibacterium tricleocarpae]|uniref:type III secretion system export apparatus subunit SctT n=1 Tax=Exilibacterium tricleocarpae TaxID=2591008 RepID=UPI0015D40E8C|nr:type III secretion system export apparatus subunit SctT [Exilibacterium tricleocarpae]
MNGFFSAFSEVESALLALALSWPRIMVILWIFPSLTEAVISTAVRSAVAISLSLIAAPVVYEDLPSQGISLGVGLAIIVKEVFIGLLIGFMIALPFWTAITIGFLIDTQRGAFMASLISPFFRGRVSPLGTLLAQALTVLFFSSGGFLVLLDSLYQSYVFWPVPAFFPHMNSGDFSYFVHAFGTILYFTVFLAAPVVLILFLIDLSMGLINRFVPQLNVFFLSLPIKGALAIFIMLIYIMTLIDYFGKKFIAIPIIFSELGAMFQ